MEAIKKRFQMQKLLNIGSISLVLTGLCACTTLGPETDKKSDAYGDKNSKNTIHSPTSNQKDLANRFDVSHHGILEKETEKSEIY